jgi:hypothetical protein
MRKLIAVAGITAGLVSLSLALTLAQSAATPRLADGHPDLNGQWYHRIGAPAPQVKPGQSYDAANAKPAGITQFNPGRPVYKPEYVAKVKDLDEHQVEKDPAWYCQPPGFPRIGPPQKIVQTPKELVFLYDDLSGNFFRVVRMNAAHRTDIEPSAHGDSVGRWEGDTLVVDVVGFNEATWLDYFGHPHTDQLHVVERFSRPNKGTLHYEALIDDPGAYTKPFTVAWDIPWRANGELTEYICQENNKYLQRLTDDFGQPIFGKK